MFENLIFDWSGTLVDDLGPVLEATNAVLAVYGREPLSRDDFRRRFRLPYGEFYAEFLPGVPMLELEDHFRSAFDASSAPVLVLPHAREKLAWCAARGVRCFVLSSMDERAFARQLEEFGLAEAFEATYAGVVDKRSKIHEILAFHHLDPAHTAFIGDMVHDVETARHGGIASIAVLTGYTHAEALAVVRPDLTVPDLLALRVLLDRGRGGVRAAAGNSAGMAAGKADRIELRRLQVECHIGVPAEERAMPQTLALNVVLEPLGGFEDLADDIGKTVDYHAVALELAALAGERPRQLIETLAVEMAEWLLASYPLAAVEVEIEKRILPQTEYVGVSVRRERAVAG
jgi:phosphoglycolate phosphatase